MKRRVFNFAAGVSLVLGVATVGLWIRGRTTWTVIAWQGEPQSGPRKFFFWKGAGCPIAGVVAAAGALVVFDGSRDDEEAGLVWFEGAEIRGQRYLRPAYSDRPLSARVGRVSATFLTLRGRDALISTGIAIPYWLLSALTFVPPVALTTQWVRRRRQVRLGLCPSCGYDLRATRERCPECGAVPTAPPS